MNFIVEREGCSSGEGLGEPVEGDGEGPFYMFSVEVCRTIGLQARTSDNYENNGVEHGARGK